MNFSAGITTELHSNDKAKQNLTQLPLVIPCYYRYSIIVFSPLQFGERSIFRFVYQSDGLLDIAFLCRLYKGALKHNISEAFYGADSWRGR